MIAAVAFWLGLLVVGHLAGRLYGSYTMGRSHGDDHRSRGTYRLLSLVGLTAVVGLTLAGLVDATETALSSIHPALAGRLAAPLAWVPTAIGTIVAVLVTYLGVFPYARERRGLEISAATAVGRLAKYLVAMAVLCLGTIAPLIVLFRLSDPSPFLIPILFAALLVWVYVWSQYSVQLSQKLVEPTADQRRRLEAAADRADLTAPLAGVVPGEETETADLYLGGSFRNRRLYATDHAFDALDDGELTALCTRANAADDLRLLERRALVVSLLFGVVLTLTVWRSMLVALLALAIVWPLLSWHLQRCEFAADRRAAQSVGADDLASAYEATADLADDRGRLHERLASRPSTARRLERLRDT
ncbi:peptidase [Natrinema longum]|uniref:Peptidase n=1 Tax=Natrinema longum TaxID=370324 RepID=A0A8A2UCE7_9EURY|nr:peptidase [Natrinema longum]MBZ6495775.1 peptidase [Natrinema longum]QSW86280.1 peptidase [Natrinema longum]